MPDLRRFTPGEAHWVPRLGRVVQPGEVVDVPAEVNGTALSWPESTWQPVEPPAAEAPPAAATRRRRAGGV